ncbi:enoyl-CoA hydratase [Pseudomonas fluorescens]|uniref:enoyl-CoA hydratase/isomerase family protein n=1 Tax=Pseudomonas fluorescens TaxID=294 RepID=UPI00054B8678|nr:enoyl-CoA hydratase-related protein [Pseudomonas fluorescens]KII37186.1 enoyl-CoA hydratase [Pseudomonas fluorescens]
MNTPTPKRLLVHLERQGALAFITLDRPETRNSFDLSMGFALRDAVRTLITDPPRVVVLRSSGAHFMVGGDVRHFDTLLKVSKAACAAELEQLISAVNEAVIGLTQLPCPVLGLISGSAAGFGLSLAMACDLIVAAEDASFLMAYSAIGATPDGGGTWHLPRHVGLHRAMKIALLNPKLDARQAQDIGLVAEVVPADELQMAGLAMAHRLANGPVAAQAGIKRLMRDGLDHDLQTALEAEKAMFIEMSATSDFQEGVSAFCQRRKANFGVSV